MSDVISRVFDYEGRQIRTALINNEPWFAAKDVSDVLGYIWNGTARIAHVPEEWRGVTSVVTPSGNQEMAVLSEQGLYFFLGRSDKPIALPFQKWLAGKVLPSIRRDGLYVTDALLNNPDHLLRVTQRLVEEHKARLEAERLLQLQAPKVELYDILLSAKNAQTMNEVAKAFGWGRNKLFAFLRDNGILMKNNLPYQNYLDSGYFDVREVSTQRGEFAVNVTQTLVTPKGIDFIGKLLDGKRVRASGE